MEQIITPASAMEAILRGSARRSAGRSRGLGAGSAPVRLEEIAAADRDDTLALHQRKLNLGRGINQAAAARKFNRAYAAAAYGQARAGLDLHR